MAGPVRTRPKAPPPDTGNAPKPKSGDNAGGGGGGGGTGYDPRAAERRANRRAQADKNKASKTYRENAKTLQGRAEALKLALVAYGDNKNQLLANVNQRLSDTMGLLQQGFDDRLSDLQGAAFDNEAASAGASFENVTNQARERASAMSEAALQGAGETDRLRAQAMSLRNWAANQGEVQRSMFDTLRSINSTIGDLNTDTQTGMANAHVGANESRSQVWNDYYNRRAETMTELGNVYGQQSEYYSKANELSGNKGGSRGIFATTQGRGTVPDYTHLGNKKASAKTRKEAEKWFKKASKEMGKAYEDPGVPRNIRKWEGASEISGNNNLSNLGTMSNALQQTERAEGATLRAW